MSNLVSVNVENFDSEVLNSNVPVIVDLYADWCHPCKAIAPILENIEKEYSGKLKFVKINIDDNFSLSDKYKIQSVPTILFFKNGNEVERIIGATSKDKIKNIIDSKVI